jgi:plastocyanin
MPRHARLAALALAAALVPGSPAHALAPHVVAAYSGGYLVGEIYLVEGDTLTLVNGDTTLDHDLRSIDFVGGSPLFSSAIIKAGQTSDVAGVSALAPGSDYPFACSIHEYMRGNIHVLAHAN